MCGIAGMAGVSDKVLLKEMLARIRHRGPDDTGIYQAEGVSIGDHMAFGNNRLSIIDLSPAGHQPMCNEDATVWVAYNGEVFNFLELREELERDGHRFQSHTDTEVLVHLYEKHGPQMVRRLNGMFAFAIWDKNTKDLWLFVDRMGVKPLYYVQVGERLYFASEIKALLACAEVQVELNIPAVYQYLAFTYVPNPDTLFQGIYKLPPGHSLHWHNCKLRVQSYWDLQTGNYYTESEAELIDRLHQLLVAATQRQLVSDVPVGIFLSGGIDSSTLVACAARSHASALQCYSIAFTERHGRLEQCSDDARFARLVADHFGGVFHEIVVEPDVANLLPKVIWHLEDLISDHAAIATYLICQAAKPEVTVLLNGQGADEIFGGYKLHLVHRVSKALRLLPQFLREGAATRFLPFLAAHKDLVFGCSPGLVLAFCRFSEKLLRTAALEPQEQYAALRSYFTDEELADLFSAELQAEIARLSCKTRFLDHFDAAAGQDFLNQMLYVDAKTFLPDHNLSYCDRLSMACSVEVRVPFLDNEIVDFSLRLPPSMKIKAFTQKYILRKAMQGTLPEPILKRRKAGFGLPVRSWLRGELREMVGDLLSEERVRRRGIFNPISVSRMIHDNNNGKGDYTAQLWSLLSLELWCEAFMDQCPATVPDRVLHSVI